MKTFRRFTLQRGRENVIRIPEAAEFLSVSSGEYGAVYLWISHDLNDASRVVERKFELMPAYDEMFVDEKRYSFLATVTLSNQNPSTGEDVLMSFNGMSRYVEAHTAPRGSRTDPCLVQSCHVFEDLGAHEELRALALELGHHLR